MMLLLLQPKSSSADEVDTVLMEEPVAAAVQGDANMDISTENVVTHHLEQGDVSPLVKNAAEEAAAASAILHVSFCSALNVLLFLIIV